MRDLSLHILDLIENSIRAGATVISVIVAENPAKDQLEITVEDNGPGLSVPFDVITDPFYTTKSNKRTGLGLSLFRSSAERAGGELTIGKSKLGGLAVKAAMQLSHIDRRPLGDLAATLSSVVCSNAKLDLRCNIRVGSREYPVHVCRLAEEITPDERPGLTIARQVYRKINDGLSALAVKE